MVYSATYCSLSSIHSPRRGFSVCCMRDGRAARRPQSIIWNGAEDSCSCSWMEDDVYILIRHVYRDRRSRERELENVCLRDVCEYVQCELKQKVFIEICALFAS